MRNPFLPLCLATILAGAAAAAAAEPVAIVEDIAAAPTAKIGVFDYVASGANIELGTGGTLVLGYLKSCLRETIKGGKVTVGRDQSAVAGGTIARERVECDGGNLRLANDQTGKSGVTVYRVPDAASQPVIKVFAISPVVGLGRHAGKSGLNLLIERVDKPATPVTLAASGKHVDLARAGVKLARGGLYKIALGTDSVMFRVDQLATDRDAPFLSRLVTF